MLHLLLFSLKFPLLVIKITSTTSQLWIIQHLYLFYKFQTWIQGLAQDPYKTFENNHGCLQGKKIPEETFSVIDVCSLLVIYHHKSMWVYIFLLKKQAICLNSFNYNNCKRCLTGSCLSIYLQIAPAMGPSMVQRAKDLLLSPPLHKALMTCINPPQGQGGNYNHSPGGNANNSNSDRTNSTDASLYVDLARDLLSNAIQMWRT